jgi:hypothetical protein
MKKTLFALSNIYSPTFRKSLMKYCIMLRTTEKLGHASTNRRPMNEALELDYGAARTDGIT